MQRMIKLPVRKDEHGQQPVNMVATCRESKSRKGEPKAVITMGFLSSSGKPGIKVAAAEFRMGLN